MKTRKTELTILGVVFALTCYCVTVRLHAAPRPKALDVPEPAAPARVAGLYAVNMDSPTIEVALEDGRTRTVWLVWGSKDDERNALGERKAGDPLVAVGECGVGGKFWYCRVQSLEVP